MSVEIVFGALEIGLIYAFISLGVLISFRLLNFLDLTADGSFPLGGAVCGLSLYFSINPWVATLLGVLAGAVAGMITAVLHVRLHIMRIVSGIIVMVAVYSINIRLLGLSPFLAAKSTRFSEMLTLPLPHTSTIFSHFIIGAAHDHYLFEPLIIFGFVVVVWFLLFQFFTTQKGLAFRAVGANPMMAQAQGIATGRMIVLGLTMSNALIAFGGALFVQTQDNVNLSFGIGTLLIGLAAMLLGENLFPTKRIGLIALSTVIGSIVYRFFIAITIDNEAFDTMGLESEDLNLITALFVILILILPTKIKASLRLRRGSSL